MTVYNCADGRLRLYNETTRKVTSYPRHILETKLGRKLTDNEQAHHIDGNPQNNDPDNLCIEMSGEHQQIHNPPRYTNKIETCFWCGKEFEWTAKQQSTHIRNCRRKKC